MENATKALIIAGAILIAILLISVSIMVFNSSSDTIDASKNRMSSTAIDTFNSKFNRYFGTNVSGTDVKSLLGEIRSSNAADDTHLVTVVLDGIADRGWDAERRVPSDISFTSSTKYVVDATGYDAGYINQITISLPE